MTRCHRSPAPPPATEPSAAPPTLSIVIPTLNAAADLGRTLDSLSGGGIDFEVIIADGGSTDATQRIARAFGAKIVAAPRGRGPQLAAGAAAAAAPWLLFLHADSALQRGWQIILRGFTGNGDNHFRAGYFQLILDDPAPQARRVEDLANWRAKALGLPYGDQGLVISRPFYDFLKGYNPLPLMEDVDLVRRIGSKRLTPLPSAVTTSALRYRRNGWWLRPLRNLLCLGLFYAGLPPRWIERLYR
ncbi:MAG: glycosyl transferase family 2 [Rhodospirillaceae bacterium]|nr:glycosyl transferase family 2 [Rhodospirillaceae bacterium]